MFTVLRFSSSVKVHGQAKIGLDLWLLLKIVLNSCSTSSKITFTQLSVKVSIVAYTTKSMPWLWPTKILPSFLTFALTEDEDHSTGCIGVPPPCLGLTSVIKHSSRLFIPLKTPCQHCVFYTLKIAFLDLNLLCSLTMWSSMICTDRIDGLRYVTTYSTYCIESQINWCIYRKLIHTKPYLLCCHIRSVTFTESHSEFFPSLRTRDRARD